MKTSAGQRESSESSVRGLDLFLVEACEGQKFCGTQAHLDLWNLSGDDVSLFNYNGS